MARFTVRERRPWRPPVCACGTDANYEVVDSEGYKYGLYCSTCAEQAAEDFNAEVTNSQEGDEVR